MGRLKFEWAVMPLGVLKRGAGLNTGGVYLIGGTGTQVPSRVRVGLFFRRHECRILPDLSGPFAGFGLVWRLSRPNKNKND